MSRIQATFAALQGKKALIPYITAGFPDLDTTLAMMAGMVENGADIIELGMPFSDPMADGQIIQKASEHAIKAGTNTKNILALVKRFRETNQHTPIVLMGYLNPILATGVAEFAREAAQAGVDGVLTVDCPSEEIELLQKHFKPAGLDCIFLLAPTTTEKRVEDIVRKASGFLYYVSLTGVTGAGTLNITQVAQKIAGLRSKTDLPIAVGFGIKDAQSAAAIAKVADAVVIGSRIIETIQNNPGQETATVNTLIKSLKNAI